MNIEKLRIHHIPALLYGEKSENLIVAVHGRHSSKIDDCIWVLAEEATKQGYQVLSFDLPHHGERVYEDDPLMVWDCVKELHTVLQYAKTLANRIFLFGCSMGAYFSLLAFAKEPIEKAWFLSPVTNMERIIQNIMGWCNITEAEFEAMCTVENPFETLYWDYYEYVKAHPITVWEHPTYILRGETDTLCEKEYVSNFAEYFGCELEEQPSGEHWFHTKEQLKYFRNWLKKRL